MSITLGKGKWLQTWTDRSGIHLMVAFPGHYLIFNNCIPKVGKF